MSELKRSPKANMPDRSTSRRLENYPADIVDWIIAHFDADTIPYVHLLLEDLKEDRLIRCALFLSRGSTKELEGAVSLGKTDYRDLIWSAEYDCKEDQLRDFNQPFPDEKRATQSPDPTRSARGSS
ncbi:MAG TPA: hypothetical protein VGM64_00355 [Lacunisphaera sp.]|jgi:hypothetical protein